jgi:hypothetical protein
LQIKAHAILKPITTTHWHPETVGAGVCNKQGKLLGVASAHLDEAKQAFQATHYSKHDPSFINSIFGKVLYCNNRISCKIIQVPDGAKLNGFFKGHSSLLFFRLISRALYEQVDLLLNNDVCFHVFHFLYPVKFCLPNVSY